jgi:hypothetical protein
MTIERTQEIVERLRIERAAKGLHEHEDSWNDYEWEWLPEGTRDLFVSQAQAALTASGYPAEILALRERVRLLSEGLDATSTHLMKMSAMLALSGDMEASDTVEGWADTARAILTEEAEMMRDDQEKISERLQGWDAAINAVRAKGAHLAAGLADRDRDTVTAALKEEKDQ